jgi:hypothetical protein
MIYIKKYGIQGLIFLVLVLGLTLHSGCRKNLLLSSEFLAFSQDTVVFDTVFTTVGSSTRRFKIFNPSNRQVNVSKVYLGGGENSPFRMNLNGMSGTSFDDVTIPGNDSLFCFVEVTLDINEQNYPMIIEDSIVFFTNGKEQRVILAVWGQDAHFYFSQFVEGVWTNDKPHVIYNVAAVDSAKSLTIEAGTRVHLHNQSLLYVRKGALHIQGTSENPVTFQGDRLEPFYKNVRGQYYGIYFEKALPSTINHAVLKNGTVGIHVFSEAPSNTGYTVDIRNTKIYNQARYGIFNYDGGKIYGENLLVYDYDLYSFFQLEGGSYNFRQCNFLSYGTDGSQPAIAIRNYFTRSDGITYIGSIPEGNIYNSVLYGSGTNQIAYDTITQGGAVTINYLFRNNLIRLDENRDSEQGFEQNFWNIDPEFKSIEDRDFLFESSSILRNNADPSFTTINDIRGITRNPSSPDIGCYEAD